MATAARRALESVLFEQGIQVSRIVIEIIDGQRFRWTLNDGQQDVFRGTAGADQIAAMTRSTEHLVMAALGVPPERETPQPQLN
jgi:hypothetical protein